MSPWVRGLHDVIVLRDDAEATSLMYVGGKDSGCADNQPQRHERQQAAHADGVSSDRHAKQQQGYADLLTTLPVLVPLMLSSIMKSLAVLDPRSHSREILTASCAAH